MTEESLNQKSKTLQISKCIGEIRRVPAEKITKKRIERIAKKHNLSITHIVQVGGWLLKYYPNLSKPF